MNKRDIICKLKADLKNGRTILLNEYCSDESKMRLEAVVGYIENMLERIQQDGKV